MIAQQSGDPLVRLVRRYYFMVASFVLLALTLVAFSDNLLTDIGQPSNRDPKFILHGLLCGAWMIAFAVQASLVSSGNVRLHRKLGIASIVIALGVTLSTIWVFVAIWKGWAAMGAEAKANRLLLPSYSLFVGLGFLNRKRREWHKRFLYIGTLFGLGPVLARAYDPLVADFVMTGLPEARIDAAFLPVFFSVWLAFFLSLFVHDAVVLRRIHPLTITGPLWFGAAWLVAVSV